MLLGDWLLWILVGLWSLLCSMVEGDERGENPPEMNENKGGEISVNVYTSFIHTE